jgi:hypothetical protein
MLVHVERELIHSVRRASREKAAILKWLDPQEPKTRRNVLKSWRGELGASEQHRASPLPNLNMTRWDRYSWQLESALLPAILTEIIEQNNQILREPWLAAGEFAVASSPGCATGNESCKRGSATSADSFKMQPGSVTPVVRLNARRHSLRQALKQNRGVATPALRFPMQLTMRTVALDRRKTSLCCKADISSTGKARLWRAQVWLPLVSFT